VRRRTSAARWSKGALAAALLALAVPASAMAHTPAATVSCTGATFEFTQFAAGSNTVNWRVTVDGATFRQGAFELPGNGRSGTLPVPYTLNDTHTVEAFAWWGPGGIQDGDTRPANAPAIAHEVVRCAPSTPPPTTTPPPATTPPASTTPPAPAGAAAPVQVPASNVAGTQARSAAARLAVPRRCATRTVRVRVTGRQIRRVTLRVNGLSVRTVNVRSGQRTVTVSVPLRRSGASRQRVQARVTFRNGTRSRTLNASARRCAQTAVRPQFTG
jgi:hypothetical protein